jgi:hypothetical protein
MTDIETGLGYYSAPGPMTRISDAHADLLDGLPGDIESLCAVVQGVIVHPQLTTLYGLESSESRTMAERDLRSLDEMLSCIRTLDPRPLTQARPTDGKLVGTCRSFATLLCGLLRFKGIPARARCGFARYFIPGRAEDHWVCEVWSRSEARWLLVDAQLDPLQREAFRISLDPLDVGRDQFLPGGLAWKQCRDGDADWNEFGLSFIGESGLWFVLGDFTRDIAALNKVELLPWDCWGLMAQGDEDRFSMKAGEVLALLSSSDVSALDGLADATANEVDIAAVRMAYEKDERIRVPASFIGRIGQS